MNTIIFFNDWIAFGISLITLAWIAWIIRDIYRYKLLTNRIVQAATDYVLCENYVDGKYAALVREVVQLGHIDPNLMNTEQMQYLEDMAEGK